jgi:hypothetical protein
MIESVAAACPGDVASLAAATGLSATEVRAVVWNPRGRFELRRGHWRVGL